MYQTSWTFRGVGGLSSLEAEEGVDSRSTVRAFPAVGAWERAWKERDSTPSHVPDRAHVHDTVSSDTTTNVQWYYIYLGENLDQEVAPGHTDPIARELA